MRKVVIEVYSDNDITEQAIYIELSGRYGNMIPSAKEEAVEREPLNKENCMEEVFAKFWEWYDGGAAEPLSFLHPETQCRKSFTAGYYAAQQSRAV